MKPSPLTPLYQKTSSADSLFPRSGPVCVGLHRFYLRWPQAPQLINIYISVWLQIKAVVDLSLSEYLISLSIAGLESYLVHGQPGLDPVFPEHSAGVGPLYLPMVVGPFLLPSPLLPRPWTHPNVQSLHCQDGESWVILSYHGRFLATTIGARHLILFSNLEF